jgi:hypothetical protein
MSDPSALRALLEAEPPSRASDAQSAFPRSAGALVDRLGSLYGLDSELEGARRVVEPVAAVPLEASVSLRRDVRTELRVSLGIPARRGDPQARLALVAALSGLGAERVSTSVDEALVIVAPLADRRRLVRCLALRAHKGEPARPRPGAWVAGETGAERSARVAEAMLRLGLDYPAAVHQRLAAELTMNPFNAAFPYGLGFDLGRDRVLGAKTYFACEWAEVALESLGGRLADELGLEGVEGFELLAAAARVDRRGARWLMELSFELATDPALGVRAKAYLPASRLASNEAEGHAAVLRLAAQLALDPRPYEKLVEAVRPDGLTRERPCSQMVGISASSRGPSLEVYLFNPTLEAFAGSPAG